MAQDTSTPYVAWSPDGQYLAVSTHAYTEIVRVSDYEVMNRLMVNRITLTAPLWSEDGEKIAFSNGSDFEIWMDPIDTPGLESRYPDAGGSKASAWSSDGQFLALSRDEYTDFWLTQSSKLGTSYINDGIGAAWSLDWKQDNEYILIGGSLAVRILNVTNLTSALDVSIEPYLDSQGFYINPIVLSAVWSPSQNQIATGASDAVWVINLDNPETPVILSLYDSDFFGGHQGQVYSVAWHPSGKFLVSGGEDGTIRIWDVTTRQQIDQINVGEGVAVRSVAWSPDGTQLAYGGSNNGEITIVTPDFSGIPTLAPNVTATP